MDGLRQTYCDRCRAMIFFIKTETGKSMPCNVNPVPYRERAGSDACVYTRSGKRIPCSFDCTKDNCDGFGYVPHWGECQPMSYEAKKRLAAYREQAARQKAGLPMGAPRPAPADKPKKAESQWVQESLFAPSRARINEMER